MISKYILLFIFFKFALSTQNATILVWDFYPVETCDMNDRWNQSKFAGLDIDILHNIILNIPMNCSEVAFYCVLSDSDRMAAYNKEVVYDKFFAVFDSWLSWPTTKIWNYSQPYHYLGFSALVSYNQPSWIFLQGIDLPVLILFYLTPIILGLFFYFIVQKVSRQFLISDYYGLLFFIPEIGFKKNISFKIISLALQLISLIFTTVFFMTLQDSFSNVKTYNHRTLDDGLSDVKIYAEGYWITKLMYTLAKPFSVGKGWFTYDEWVNFIQENEGGTFVTSLTLANVFTHIDCNLKLLGDIFYVTDVMDEGFLTREEHQKLNAAIIDTMEYRKDYIPVYPIEEMLDSDNITCAHPSMKIKSRYTFNDFKELWILYFAGMLIAVAFKIRSLIKLMYSTFHFKAHLTGYTSKRYKDVRSSIGKMLTLYLVWFEVYRKSVLYPMILYRLKNFKKLLNEKKEFLDKIKKCRSKIVRRHFKKFKRNYFKIAIFQISYLLRSKKISQHSKKIKFIDNIIKRKKKINIKKGKQFRGKEKLKKAIRISLKHLLFDGLESFNICKPNSGLLKRRLKENRKINEVWEKEFVEKKMECQLIKNSIEKFYFKKTLNTLPKRALQSRGFRVLKKFNDQVNRYLETNYRLPLSTFVTNFMELVDNSTYVYTSQFQKKKKQSPKKKIVLVNKNLIQAIQIGSPRVRLLEKADEN